MTDNASSDSVYIVSFQVDEKGHMSDYAVDLFDLAKHPNAWPKLRGLVNKGVFYSYEAAENWAKSQSGEPCCQKGCSGCGRRV